MNFQPILDCFIPNFKWKYENLENTKADRVNTVVFNLHQIKRRAFFWDTRYFEHNNIAEKKTGKTSDRKFRVD